MWGETCGEMTNCQLYNTDKMRQYISWFPAACLAISFLADVGVWLSVGNLQLYQDDQEEEEKEEKGDMQEDDNLNHLEMTSKDKS